MLSSWCPANSTGQVPESAGKSCVPVDSRGRVKVIFGVSFLSGYKLVTQDERCLGLENGTIEVRDAAAVRS